MIAQDQIIVYGGTSNHIMDDIALKLAKSQLGFSDLKFTHVTHKTWGDREPGFRLNRFDEIAGKTVVIFSSPVDDKLELQLRDMVNACRWQYHAKRIIVVMSFLRYRRQDHVDKHHEITRLRLFIKYLHDWGVDHLIVCDPHNAEKTSAFCQEFPINLTIADPTALFVDATRLLLLSCGLENVVLFSPDFGSVKRALAMAECINVPLVALPKRRINGRLETVPDPMQFEHLLKTEYQPQVPLSCNISDVKGKVVVFREDEVDSGRTSAMQAWELHKVGVRAIYLLATHPVCSDGWRDNLFPYGEKQPFTQVYLGDTRRRGDFTKTDYEGSTGGEVIVVSMAPILAKGLVHVLESLPD